MLPALKAAGKTVVLSHEARYFDAADGIVRLESGALVQEEEKTKALEPTLR